MDALGLAAGKRARGAIQGQIAQPDRGQVTEAVAQLAHQSGRPLGLLAAHRKLLDPLGQRRDRHPAQVGDIAALDLDVERFRAQLGACARRAGYELAVSGQKDSDVSFVAAAFHPFKEAANPRPSILFAPAALARLAVEQPGAFFGGELLVGCGEPNSAPARAFHHPGVHLAVGRRAPGSHQPLTDREVVVGNDLGQVQFDGAAESLAFRAGADRAVGREQGRGGLGEGGRAARAVKAAVKEQRRRRT